MAHKDETISILQILSVLFSSLSIVQAIVSSIAIKQTVDSTNEYSFTLRIVGDPKILLGKGKWHTYKVTTRHLEKVMYEVLDLEKAVKVVYLQKIKGGVEISFDIAVPKNSESLVLKNLCFPPSHAHPLSHKETLEYLISLLKNVIADGSMFRAIAKYWKLLPSPTKEKANSDSNAIPSRNSVSSAKDDAHILSKIGKISLFQYLPKSKRKRSELKSSNIAMAILGTSNKNDDPSPAKMDERYKDEYSDESDASISTDDGSENEEKKDEKMERKTKVMRAVSNSEVGGNKMKGKGVDEYVGQKFVVDENAPGGFKTETFRFRGISKVKR